MGCYSQRTRVEGEVKLVAPVAVTQREGNKEEMPSCSQAARRCNANCRFTSRPPPRPLRVLFLGTKKTARDSNRTHASHPPLRAQAPASQLMAVMERMAGKPDLGLSLLVDHLPAPRKALVCSICSKSSGILAFLSFMHLLETSLN